MALDGSHPWRNFDIPYQTICWGKSNKLSSCQLSTFLFSFHGAKRERLVKNSGDSEGQTDGRNLYSDVMCWRLWSDGRATEAYQSLPSTFVNFSVSTPRDRENKNAFYSAPDAVSRIILLWLSNCSKRRCQSWSLRTNSSLGSVLNQFWTFSRACLSKSERQHKKLKKKILMWINPPPPISPIIWQCP